MSLRSVELRGGLGRRFEGNLAYLRRRAAEADLLLYPFEHRDRWRRVRDGDGEYVGKWLDAAALAADATGDATLLAATETVAARLRATQEDDGYLGCELPDNRLRPWFPLWMHWLAVKGLRTHGQLRGDEACVESAVRGATWLVRLFGPVRDAGHPLFQVHNGTLSFLDELAACYAITSDAELIDFAAAAVRHYPPFAEMRKTGRIVREHAYSLLTYLGGAVETARALGDADTLGWLAAIWEDLAANHLFPAASLSVAEHVPAPLVDKEDGELQETCATVEWLLFTQRLYGATGDVRYLHMIERTVRNALLGAQAIDGLAWTYFTPLRKVKKWFGGQTACCYFSGPRGIARLPHLVYRAEGRAACVDLFETSRAVFDTPGGPVELHQESGYPERGEVSLRVAARAPVSFALQVRVPEHVRNVRIDVNGEAVAPDAGADGRVPIARSWRDGDTVRLRFDLETRLERLADGSAVIVRGVQVLAADRTDNDADLGTLSLPGPVDVEEDGVSPDGRPRYRAALRDGGATRPVRMTPYADAGNSPVGTPQRERGYRAAFPDGSAGAGER